MKKWKVTYILILTLCGLLYLYRESINTYWIQTYHKESPLVALESWSNGIVNDLKGNDSKLNPQIEDENSVSTYVDTQLDPDISLNNHDEGMNKDLPRTHDNTQAQADVMDDIESLLSLGIEESQAASNDGTEGRKDLVPADNDVSALMPALELGSIAGLDLESEQFVGPKIPQLPDTAYLKAGDKIFFVGDSMMQGVAPRVRQLLYKSENIDGIDLSKQSTGLAYPSFYDWPKVVEDTLKTDGSIRAVIVYLGANDPWDFPNQTSRGKRYLKFKSPEWERAYRERIQKILLSAAKYNLPVIWLGAPCMRKTDLHNGMVYLNKLYQSEVERFNGRYITTSDVLGCSDDGYIAYAETDKGNQKVRTNDGIHFTVTGQRLIADKIVQYLVIEKEPESDVIAEPDQETMIDKNHEKAEDTVDSTQSNKSDEPTQTAPAKMVDKSSNQLNEVNEPSSQIEEPNPEDRVDYDISLQGNDHPQKLIIPPFGSTKQTEKRPTAQSY